MKSRLDVSMGVNVVTDLLRVVEVHFTCLESHM